MNQVKITSMMWWVLPVSVLAVRAYAQSTAGSCAGVQGTVEVQHAGTWQTASVGSTVFVGDHLRTGAHSRATVVFRDDSVLDLAPTTELSFETQDFDESAHRFRSLFRLAAGRVRVWASAYYSEAGARYEVETPTAIAAVRGTQFIASYESTSGITDIVGLDGQVEVHAKLAVMGAGVEVGPHFITRVPKGRFPSPPQHVDDARLPQYLEGVDLVGTGRRDGLNVLHPAIVGRVLTPQDVPSGGAALRNGPRAAPALTVEAPLVGSVADNLSADVYTNTQPLTHPSTGGVHVGF